MPLPAFGSRRSVKTHPPALIAHDAEGCCNRGVDAQTAIEARLRCRTDDDAIALIGELPVDRNCR